MFDKIIGGYDNLWKAIIRPPRDNYSLSNLGNQIIKDPKNSPLKVRA
jgi:hypothetical protein